MVTHWRILVLALVFGSTIFLQISAPHWFPAKDKSAVSSVETTVQRTTIPKVSALSRHLKVLRHDRNGLAAATPVLPFLCVFLLIFVILSRFHAAYPIEWVGYAMVLAGALTNEVTEYTTSKAVISGLSLKVGERTLSGAPADVVLWTGLAIAVVGYAIGYFREKEVTENGT